MSRKLLNIKEAANYLNVSVNTIYAWVSQRRMPFVKLGRRLLFDVEDLDRWIDGKKMDEKVLEYRPKRYSI